MRLRRQKKLIKKAKLTAESHPVNQLMQAVENQKNSYSDRGYAAKHLKDFGDDRGIRLLLQEFYATEDEIKLFETALAIEDTKDRSAIGPMIRALKDANPHRRNAAARALGWIRTKERSAARALVAFLADPSQPQAARATATESLAYLNYAGSVPTLLAILKDPDPTMRFWACFALGSLEIQRLEAQIVSALTEMFDDHGEKPGYWAVRLEALMMLAHHYPPRPHYRQLMLQELKRIDEAPNASKSERFWTGWVRD